MPEQGGRTIEIKKRIIAWLILIFAICADARAGGETLEVLFFDCGKADCALILQGGHAMLIDAGYDTEAPYVLRRLAEEGVETLAALLVTHEHKDHSGGAGQILEALKAERVFMGPEIEGGNRHTDLLGSVMRDMGLPAEPLLAGDAFELGSARITVLGPPEFRDGRSANNASIVVRVDFGNTRFLFTGDIENRAIRELLDAPVNAQVLKAPHHGGRSKLSSDFFEAVSPDIAVITCERDVWNNFPDPATVEDLVCLGAEVFITGDGEVRIVSDGESLEVYVESPRYP